MILDISNDEVLQLLEFVQTLLGGESIDVSITEKEISILARKALRDYEQFINEWQLRSGFSNIVGFKSSTDFTRKFITENTMIASRVSDWFAALTRIGGKIKWKKDFILLEQGRQVYDLSTESSVPYKRGDRKIHRVLWVSRPEISGNDLTPDMLDGGLLSLGWGSANSMFGQNMFSYLGNAFDIVLLAQSLELRRKVMGSEFFYNISGDIIELTPMPGGTSYAVQPGAKVFYYYFDVADFLGLEGQDEDEANELICNPTQVQLNEVPWSKLNSPAKNWIENYTLALGKYTVGSKLRAVRKIASPGSEYEIEFDYQSLLTESADEKLKMKEDLMLWLDDLTPWKQMENKASIVENSAKVNKHSPRKFFIGSWLPFLFLLHMYI